MRPCASPMSTPLSSSTVAVVPKISPTPLMFHHYSYITLMFVWPQSLPEGKAGAKYLLWWYTEDQIKVRYNLFLGALEEASKDNLEFVKDKATKVNNIPLAVDLLLAVAV